VSLKSDIVQGFHESPGRLLEVLNNEKLEAEYASYATIALHIVADFIDREAELLCSSRSPLGIKHIIGASYAGLAAQRKGAECLANIKARWCSVCRRFSGARESWGVNEPPLPFASGGPDTKREGS
jgi:hypothetical protein